jgi:uncharacterized OB-fold protein
MTTATPLPAVDFLKIPEKGDPYLEGLKCNNCGAIYLGGRTTCSKCGARDQLKPHKLGNKGKLYAYSIVHRSFPGVEVPYMINIEPDPKNLKFDMPVDIVIKDAGRKDREGNSYLAYFFQPRAA